MPVLSSTESVGTIKSLGHSVLPAGWLLCDGSAINRTLYGKLFSFIATNWGDGDGSTTYNVPDLRGYFLRGQSSGTGNDPDAGSRYAISGGNTGDMVGSYESHAMQQHYHYYGAFAQRAGGGLGVDQGVNFGTTYITDTVYGANVSGETRPLNANVTYMIKYL